MVKVSVIIPIYKVGKYIENSMKSVASQYFKDFEVILIDNNTPDDSIEIAENILKGTDVNYRVVKQPIQGLPAARNKGIEEAKGEWIVSIDPDDTISSFFLKELYDLATNNGLNVVFSSYDEVSDNLFEFPHEQDTNAVSFFSKEEILDQLLSRKLPLMVSNMFINKNYFTSNGFEFDQNVILGADLLLLWRIMMETPRIAVFNKCLYNHYERPDSLMTAPSQKKVDSNLSGYKKQLATFERLTNKEFAEWIYSREVYALLSTISIHGTYDMFKYNIRTYYTNFVYDSLSRFPNKYIRIMNVFAYRFSAAFYFINKHIRKPDSVLNKIVRKIVR